MAQNNDARYPSVMGDALGANVDNAAVQGARFSNESALGRAVGFDVRAQYSNRPWDIVLIKGGANEFVSECDGRACDAVLDGLISSDLTGEVPKLIGQVCQRVGHRSCGWGIMLRRDPGDLQAAAPISWNMTRGCRALQTRRQACSS